MSQRTVSIFGQAIWDIFGRFANFFVVFGASVFLARMIPTADFGAFGIVISIVGLSMILVDAGLKQAIIQRQDTDQQQLSTVFYLNIVFGAILLAIVCLSAPLIESFYGRDDLSGYIFASSSLFVINAIGIVPGGLLNKSLDLRSISLINLTSAAVSGVFAVSMAYSGFTIWALVAQQIVASTINSAGYFIAAKWTPAFTFDLHSVRGLWSFSSRLLMSSAIYQTVSRMDVFIIGKVFNLEVLGFYTRSQGVDGLIRNFSSGTTTAVILPTFSRLGDDTKKICEYYHRSLHFISFIAFFMSGFLFLVCKDLVILLYSERWAISGDFFRIMAITAFVYPLLTLMVSVITARGNARAILSIALYCAGLYLAACTVLFFGDMYHFLAALAVLNLVTLFMDIYYVRKEIGVTFSEHLYIIGQYALVTLVITAASFLLASPITNIYTHLLISGVIYSIFTLCVQGFFRFKGFMELWSKIAQFRGRRETSQM